MFEVDLTAFETPHPRKKRAEKSNEKSPVEGPQFSRTPPEPLSANVPQYTRQSRRRKAEPESDRRKQSLYFPTSMLDEIEAEAQRQDRSLSWIVQQAWKLARSTVTRFPSAP